MSHIKKESDRAEILRLFFKHPRMQYKNICDMYNLNTRIAGLVFKEEFLKGNLSIRANKEAIEDFLLEFKYVSIKQARIEFDVLYKEIEVIHDAMVYAGLIHTRKCKSLYRQKENDFKNALIYNKHPKMTIDELRKIYYIEGRAAYRIHDELVKEHKIIPRPQLKAMEDNKVVLKAFNDNPEYDSFEMRNHLNLSSSELYNVQKKLIKKGLIEKLKKGCDNYERHYADILKLFKDNPTASRYKVWKMTDLTARQVYLVHDKLVKEKLIEDRRKFNSNVKNA